MLEISIPGRKPLLLHHLVLDYNGTIACDGRLLEGVEERLATLSGSLGIHVLTADTFGGVERQLSHMACHLYIISKEDQARAKLRYIENLGAAGCACMGNGQNDRLMLKEAGLGIAIVEREGASLDAVLEADVVATSIIDALDLLLKPLRLIATLRS
ncbi:MAG: ATPase P [Desulforhabdus sp.]|jgi:soluble P-type ATPase|nr:ATPase P [Desulforhabdus sp.]